MDIEKEIVKKVEEMTIEKEGDDGDKDKEDNKEEEGIIIDDEEDDFEEFE